MNQSTARYGYKHREPMHIDSWTPVSEIADHESQVALLPNITKNKKFLDGIFRDVNLLSKGGTKVCGAKTS